MLVSMAEVLASEISSRNSTQALSVIQPVSAHQSMASGATYAVAGGRRETAAVAARRAAPGLPRARGALRRGC